MNLSESHRRQLVVGICGALMVVLSALLSWLSLWFAFDSDPVTRPLILFLVLMTAIFVVHMVGFRAALTFKPNARIVAMIWAVAILARLVILPSHPIQEVDLYRYLWDGQVTSAGVSPFKYSPATVIAAVEQGESGDPQLDAIAQLATQKPAIETILRRVHFGELPTVYPSVSQCVFALVAALTPDDASVHTHVTSMKFAIVCFDLGVIAVLAWLLRMAELHFAWVITYAWNPLVLKEFAGSGHLDSIAVFFSILSVALVVKAIKDPQGRGWMAASVWLALGFGAKLYPIVLFPVLLVAGLRSAGFARATKIGFLFAAVAVCCLLPVALTEKPSVVVAPIVEFDSPLGISDELQPPDFFDELRPLDELRPPLPDDGESTVASSGHVPTNPTDGIATFLWRWEMNDLVFLVIIENVKPMSQPPWFCITPESFRVGTSKWTAGRLGTDDADATFFLARAVTVLMFLVVGLWLLLRMPAHDPIGFGRTAFLVMAFFWMLSPTLNPWYWTWALPLVCFARSTGWLLVSGMLTLYYLRFWMIYHSDHAIMQFAPYPGATSFDFVIVFLEHLPWMLLVGWQSRR